MVRETIENRKLVKMYLDEGVMFQPHQVAELGSFGHEVQALESRTQRRVMKSSSETTKAMEARNV